MSGKRCKGDIVDFAFHILNETKAEIDRLSLELRKLKNKSNKRKKHYDYI